jgi:PAS domain S-box-containing protein
MIAMSRIHRSPLKSYFILAFSIIGLILLNHLITQIIIGLDRLFERNLEAVRLIQNQQTLAEQVHLGFYQLKDGDIEPFNLQERLDEWQSSQEALQAIAGRAESFPSVEMHLEEQVGELTQHLAFMQQQVEAGRRGRPMDQQGLMYHKTSLLQKLDRLELQLDYNIGFLLNHYLFKELILGMVLILVILVEVNFIFRPIDRKMRRAIDDLRDSTNKLNAILDSTGDSNIFLSPDLYIKSFNRVAAQHVRLYYGREMQVGEDFRSYITPDTAEMVHDYLYRALQGEIIVQEWEFKWGDFAHWFEFNYHPVYDEQQNIIGLSFNSIDIDARKRYELQLEAQNCQLRNITWMQSHELRRPVANIIPLVELLQEQWPGSDPEAQTYLQALRSETAKMDAIIHRIVDETNHWSPKAEAPSSQP